MPFNSGYNSAIRLENIFSKRRARSVAFAVMVIAIVGVLISFYPLPYWAFRNAVARLALGIGIPFVVYYMFVAYLQESRASLIRYQDALDSKSPEMLLDFAASSAIAHSITGDSVSVRDFFLHLLKMRQFTWSLSRLNIHKKYFTEKVSGLSSSLNLQALLATATQIMASDKSLELSLTYLLPAVIRMDRDAYQIFFDMDVKEEELVAVGKWYFKTEDRMRNEFRFWDPEALSRVKGVGKDWSAAYTPNLDRVGHDLTTLVEYNKPAHVYGHKKYIEQVEQYLVDGTHNALLVGPPGIGRHAIVNNLAALMNSGEVLGPLKYQRLVQIDSSSILSSTLANASQLDKIRLLFSEALWAGNIILVVNNIDAFFDSKEEVGRVNATEALLPFLKSGLRIIGLTTLPGFQNTIGKNSELMRWFGKIDVREPDFNETMSILQDHVSSTEMRSGLTFTYQALAEIVNLATRLIMNLPNPEKSLEILDATAIYMRTKTTDNRVLPEHVQYVITQRTQIPVNKVSGKEKDLLINMEALLHERIIGQDEAIVQISNALRRARAGIRSEKRPIGSFLFLGPTGVGKTETTKALSAVYFGSENRIIRVDMSEFQEVHGINRLIGDKDKNDGGILTEAIIANPFSIVLLDELEKAHPKILDLFLQVLDEGYLTDALGRRIDFTNTMIIATSNAGAEIIREGVKSGKPISTEVILEFIQKSHIYRPEFVNRFDGVVIFKPLTPEQLLEVARLLLTDLNRRLRDKEVTISITQPLLEYVVSHAYSPEYGARPLRRFVAEHIENYVAQGLIANTLARGTNIEFSPEILAKL